MWSFLEAFYRTVETWYYHRRSSVSIDLDHFPREFFRSVFHAIGPSTEATLNSLHVGDWVLI